jgi:hypothetical protein
MASAINAPMNAGAPIDQMRIGRRSAFRVRAAIHAASMTTIQVAGAPEIPALLTPSVYPRR